ncbi:MULTISPECIES: FliH/SctL family protein [Acidobacteriaceae]|uniref:FliH/SctL family protein n=1 Tax=Acidobacteriaceae TaxID=204434 RepID=UPI00131B4904|nr:MULTISPECIES: FliH/SctL family protein [Acidobacteriaceae]MDW5264323.1 FliH/SctL family protein [Edaphobacter sp.]
MISLSEDASNGRANNALPGMPERPINGTRKRNDISRLEFHAVSEPGTSPAQNLDAVQVFDAAEVYTQEQVEELTHQLKLQQLEFEAQLERVRGEARIESREQWEAELSESVAAERARVAHVCEKFAEERKRYFIAVEAEVVKLALAIAERILHREAKLDPLLLTAAVRVVLDKVADNSTMELRVPAAELERWKDALVMETKSRVQLMGDERLGIGECVLETSVGKVELGVSAQLEEIEKGFFDLLQQRPA